MPYVIQKNAGQEIKIFYECVGEGDPIVFHHGNGNRVEDWYSLGYVDELSRDHQLILIDSRGYGKSSKPHDPAAYNLFSRATDTIAVLNDLGIEKAHCFGGSIGASVCMFLAKYYPERFKSYILATPYFVQFDENIKQALQKGPTAYLAKLEDLLGARLDNELIRQTFLANDTQAVWAANSSEWFDYREYAHYLSSPTLIYVGSEEPSVNELISLSKQLSNCQIQILPGVEHVQAYWNSKLVAPLIREFVRSVR